MMLKNGKYKVLNLENNYVDLYRMDSDYLGNNCRK